MGGDILIVDDDEALRDALDLELSTRGWKVRTASNGAEALERVREALPMLILLDLEMPVMNGRRMLQALRQMPLGADVPVMILSAFGYEWEAELMGAQGYIRKPVGTRQLEEAIARVLTGAKAPRAVMLN
jgi:CheY-like chemotaxis protein